MSITINVSQATGGSYTATATNADGVNVAVSSSAADTLSLTVGGGVGPPGAGNVALAAGDGILITSTANVATINCTVEGVPESVLENLSNVFDQNATTGDVLAYNGTAWASSSNYATLTYVDNAVANLVDAAPGALDTLNELAAAIGDDANFSATITTSLASKAAANHTHTFQDITNGTATVTGNLTLDPSTGGVIISGGTSAGSLTLNCENNTHGVTIESPAHSANATYTLTLPSSAGSANQVLTTDGSGSLSWSNGSSGSGGISWTTPAPGNSSDSGSAGDVAYGGQYFYLHNGTQWNRVQLSSFGSTGGGGGAGNVTTYRLLTESSDTLLTESGDYLSHDGNGTGGNGTTSSGNWTQVYSDIDGAAVSAQIEQADLTNNGTTLFVAAPQQSQLRMFVDNGSAWAEQTSSAFSPSLTSGLWPQSVSVSSAGDKILTLALNAYESGNGTAFHAALLADSGGWSLVDRIYSTSDIASAACLALSSDGSRAIVSTYSGSYGPWGDDRTLRLFDVSSNFSQLATVGGISDGLSKLGLSVAIDGDGLRVAATYSTGAFTWNGSDYVWDGSPEREGVKTFDYSGGSLTAFGGNLSGTAGTDAFGYSMSFSDDGSRLAVGAPYGAGGGTQRGYVRVYDWSGSAWVQSGSDVTGSADGDLAGWSVDLSAAGTRLVVGLRQRDGNGTDSGTTRVYDWNGSAWAQIGTDITGSASYDYSGSGVAISGDGSRIAVGAPGNDDGGSGAGQVRVFEAT